MKNIHTYLRSFATLSFLFLSAQGSAQYLVTFDSTGETKTAYASANVTLSGISWNLTEALIGTDANDRKNGTRAARVRSTGTMTMLADKANGLGSLSIQHASYGSDAAGTWKAEYSTDAGTTWVAIRGREC